MKELFVVRHCSATGQEADAPLTPEGDGQAAALADFLAPLGVERIVASPFRRAHASIAPLARRLGLAIEPESRLAERVLAGGPRPDWLALLRQTFTDLDLCPEGGESSRAAWPGPGPFWRTCWPIRPAARR
ncbi:MAG TPA: histidine phosphatase family protein [Symbiobacteriaceae bacterium]